MPNSISGFLNSVYPNPDNNDLGKCNKDLGKWVYVNKKIQYTAAAPLHYQTKKIESIFSIINKILERLKEQKVSPQQKDSLLKFSELVNQKTIKYKEKHGRIYLWLSNWLYGDVDKLREEISNKINQFQIESSDDSKPSGEFEDGTSHPNSQQVDNSEPSGGSEDGTSHPNDRKEVDPNPNADPLNSQDQLKIHQNSLLETTLIESIQPVYSIEEENNRWRSFGKERNDILKLIYGLPLDSVIISMNADKNLKKINELIELIKNPSSSLEEMKKSTLPHLHVLILWMLKMGVETKFLEGIKEKLILLRNEEPVDKINDLLSSYAHYLGTDCNNYTNVYDGPLQPGQLVAVKRTNYPLRKYGIVIEKNEDNSYRILVEKDGTYKHVPRNEIQTFTDQMLAQQNSVFPLSEYDNYHLTFSNTKRTILNEILKLFATVPVKNTVSSPNINANSQNSSKNQFSQQQQQHNNKRRISTEVNVDSIRYPSNGTIDVHTRQYNGWLPNTTNYDASKTIRQNRQPSNTATYDASDVDTKPKSKVKKTVTFNI